MPAGGIGIASSDGPLLVAQLIRNFCTGRPLITTIEIFRPVSRPATARTQAGAGRMPAPNRRERAARSGAGAALRPSGRRAERRGIGALEGASAGMHRDASEIKTVRSHNRPRGRIHPGAGSAGATFSALCSSCIRL